MNRIEIRKVVRRALVAPALLMILIFAACSGGDSREILIDGSSTVFPISEVVAEEFRKVNPGVQIPLGISGTGGGFKRFVVGETDISNASRPIKDSEREEAAENGIEFTEFTVAYDGLSVVMHPSNDFASCLTSEELKMIWEPDSKLNNWNEIRSEYPDKPLRLYGPDSDSGTFDYFTDAINGDEDLSRTDYTASSDDNVLVQGVSGDQASMGYFGFAYYTFNKHVLNVLSVDDGDGCVTPTLETINDGSYSPLSRPIYIYVNNASMERADTKAFIEFYLENAGELAELVGYVGLPEESYQAQLELID